MGLSRENTRLWNEDGTALTEELFPMLAFNANVTLEDAGTAPVRLALGTTYDASVPGTFTCGKLYINGESFERVTWGSSDSTAEFVDDLHFYGSGVLKVQRDDLRSAIVIILR